MSYLVDLRINIRTEEMLNITPIQKGCFIKFVSFTNTVNTRSPTRTLSTPIMHIYEIRFKPYSGAVCPVIKAGFRDHSGQLTKGSGKYIIFLTLKAPKMPLKMSSAEVVCCK